MSEGARTAEEVVFAVCHEVGNLLAALRLESHLLEPQLSPVELARASVSLDRLAARAGALLSLVRPLLSRVRPVSEPLQPGTLLGLLAQALEEHGLGGRRVELIEDDEAPRVRADVEVLQPLLLSAALALLERAAPDAPLQLLARAVASGTEIGLSCASGEAPELADWPSRSPRGAALVCAIADVLARGWGGELRVARADESDRVELCVWLPGPQAPVRS